ncbi:hypothetical protein [Pilimelia terevasa]|uniref:hypothetical protein n=1 Tax=Pilimelia terevasa TaxID=53372 RepID=UPI001E534268|nr:hypothetical protein [Pilimelia terevasa]
MISAKRGHTVERILVTSRRSALGRRANLRLLMQHRRLARDYETVPQRSRAMIYWAVADTNQVPAESYRLA